MQSESHPSMHNQGPARATANSKESFSVYGLFHHFAHTPQGKYMLRQYFLRPTLNEALIKERLDAISNFLKPDNTESVQNLVKSLKGIVNARNSTVSLPKGITGGSGKSGQVASSVWSDLQHVSFLPMRITKLQHEISSEASVLTVLQVRISCHWYPANHH